MSTFVYAANEAEMTIKPEEEKTTNLVNIENIDTDIGINQVPTVKAYGTTLVNLLGKYGNFETDSNADGLADGWANDAALTAVVNAMDTTSEIFGSKCQKITLSADGEGGNYIEVTVAAAQALFVAGYIRAGDTSTTGKLIVDWRDNTDMQISTDTVGTNATASYVRKSALLTAPANTVKARIYITVAGVSGKLAYFDGIQVNNLTAQGALDPVRAAKYGVTNWSDLTTAQLEAEIPYFDSVQSVNVSGGTSSEITVENRGKNLFDIHKLYEATESLNITRTITTKDGYDVFRVISNYAAGKVVYNRFKPNTRYRIIAMIYVESPSTYNLTFSFRYTDGSITNLYPSSAFNKWYLHAWVSTAGKTVADVTIGYASNSAVTNVAELMLIEYGTDLTYTLSRTDSITIPDSVELHGYNGVFNTIDSEGNYVKNWERADKTTDGAGAFALTGYATGSKVICRNKTSGEVEVLNAAASVTTSWTETDIEILYRLATAVESIVQLESTGFMLYPGDNNVLSPDSKTPVAIQVSDYTGVSSTSSTQAFIERFRATTKRGGRTFQPYGSRVLKSVPTSEEVAISLSKMNIDDETIGLALDGGHFQIENTYVNVNDGSEITDTYKHCRITSHGKEYSAGDIVKEDVEIECAKVVTS